MEDFFKFLLIAAIVIIGIVREANKNKAKKSKENRPVTPMQPKEEMPSDVNPYPEPWGRKALDEVFRPIPMEHPTAPVSSGKSKKREISVEASLANSVAQDKQNSQQGSHYDSPLQGTSTNETEDYSIHSAEEARRAIIWSEILQRKY